MDKFIKNIEFEKIFAFENQVEYQQGQIVSKTLAQNNSLSLTLFSEYRFAVFGYSSSARIYA